MSRSVLVVQHALEETAGSILEVLEGRAIEPVVVRSFAGAPVPRELGRHEGLILMGGPQSVYEQDRYPYLTDELRLIEDALRAGRPVMGICLGSQLLAEALGGRVTKGARKEIGWHRVTMSDAGLIDPIWKGVESSFVAFHWHGDVFSLPDGAASIARSELTEHQAFRHGTSAYGILFHLETTQELVEQMVRAFDEELRAADVDPARVLREAEQHLPALALRGREVFEAWASLLEGNPQGP